MAARQTRHDPSLVRPRLGLAKEASTDYIHDVHEAMTTTTALPALHGDSCTETISRPVRGENEATGPTLIAPQVFGPLDLLTYNWV